MVCANCWELVVEPCIKGVWIHYHDITNGCMKIIPISDKVIIEVQRHIRFSCEHEFRYSSMMKYMVKCIKCELPIRFGLYEHEISAIGNFYCFDCKTKFKNMSTHEKKHRGKNYGFEFKILPTDNINGDAI